MKSPPGKETGALLHARITNGLEQPVTTRQLAEHLQVTTRTLASYRAARKIPFWKINARNFRYKISDVERALAK
jgi:Helix-turn-helix domain